MAGKQTDGKAQKKPMKEPHSKNFFLKTYIITISLLPI